MSRNKFLLTLSITFHFVISVGSGTRVTLPKARNAMTERATVRCGMGKELEGASCIDAVLLLPRHLPVLLYYIDKCFLNRSTYLATQSLQTVFQRLSPCFSLTNILVCKIQLSYFPEI